MASVSVTSSFTHTLPFEKVHHVVVAPALNINSQVLIRSKNKTLSQEKYQQKRLAPLPPPETPKEPVEDTNNNSISYDAYQYVNNDIEFEKYMTNVFESSLCEATEKLFINHFDASECIYWQNSVSLESLYSPTNFLFSKYSNSIAGTCFSENKIINITKPKSHPKFLPEIDGRFYQYDCPTLLFPLTDYCNVVVAVVQIIRGPGAEEFTSADESFVSYFQRKFQLYSRWITQNNTQEPILLDILNLADMEHLVPELSVKLKAFFDVEDFEVWSYEYQKKRMTRHSQEGNQEIDPQDYGIIANLALNEKYLHTGDISAESTEDIPTKEYEFQLSNRPMLVIPVSDMKGIKTYSVVLAGTPGKGYFPPETENQLKKIAPFVALAVSNAMAYSEIYSDYQKKTTEREGLAALLEVAEILSRQLDIGRLCEIIMEKGRYLTKSDRCSLFLVSNDGQSLTTQFHRGLKNGIEIPITKGIVGKTATEAKILNIRDAYEDPNFDQRTDKESGYRTTSILSVPIFNNRGKVIGVTEMINKMEGDEFTQWDQNLIQIFNVFCGISLENVRLFNESKDMSLKLRSFFGISLSLNSEQDIKRVMTDILRNARRGLGARRASLFMLSEDQSSLESYIVDGGKLPKSIPITRGIIGACARTQKGIISNDPYTDTRFNQGIDRQTGYKTQSLVAAPILKSDGTVLGVVEMVNKQNGNFENEDLTLLQSFAAFMSVSLENTILKETNAPPPGPELPKWVLDTSFAENMVLSQEQIAQCSGLNFFAPSWAGDDLVRMIMTVFKRYNVLSILGTSTEVFARFIFELRQTYNDVPYHNWIHACDVLQYVTYELSKINASTFLTPLEISALLISAVCHDANHEGYNNVFNVKTETPLGILYKDQSVMESHHCSVTISILQRDECNILHALSPEEHRAIWTYIIRLILATDMAFHFKFVKTTNEALDAGTFDVQKPDDRLTAMQLLLKVADISNVSRPFDIADKWCDILCEEFFRQGDSEKKAGIELTSPLNDREHPDKPKSQIGFYNFVCIPLYQVVARVFPNLTANLESVQANLEVWKSLAQQQAPPEAAK